MSSISSCFPLSHNKGILKNTATQVELLLGTRTLSGLEATLDNSLHGLSKGSLPFSLPVYSNSHADILLKLIKLRSKFPEWKSATGKRIVSGSRLGHSSVMQENRMWKPALIWHCLFYCYLSPKEWERSSSHLRSSSFSLGKKNVLRNIYIYKKHHVLDTASCIKLLFWCLLKWSKQV